MAFTHEIYFRGNLKEADSRKFCPLKIWRYTVLARGVSGTGLRLGTLSTHNLIPNQLYILKGNLSGNTAELSLRYLNVANQVKSTRAQAFVWIPTSDN